MKDNDNIFEAKLADRRHNELHKVLKKIAEFLSKEKSNQDIVDAITEQIEKTGDLAKVIENIPKSEKPIVNVEIKNDEILNSIQEICNDVVKSNNKVIESLENRKLPDTFDLKKNRFGVTESVKVNYKSAKEIN